MAGASASPASLPTSWRSCFATPTRLLWGRIITVGVFGTGLYSGDFAMDLRSTVRAVLRLPFAPDRLVDILCESEPSAAKNPADEDHTTFWLAVADLFAKRGIESARVRDTALVIIDKGTDLATLEELGMTAPNIRKRKKILDELRARLLAPIVSKPRPVLKAPQPLLMGIGDVFVYPTCAGQCINPYIGSREMQKFHRKDGSVSWEWRQDGWAAMVVVDRGRAFDFLSWYRPLTVAQATDEKPTLEGLRGELLWKLSWPSTCTATHLKRMELEKIGVWPIDDAKLRGQFRHMQPGTNHAINDISLANGLNVGPSIPASAMPRPGEPPTSGRGRPYPTILGIVQILAD